MVISDGLQAKLAGCLTGSSSLTVAARHSLQYNAHACGIERLERVAIVSCLSSPLSTLQLENISIAIVLCNLQTMLA